MSSLRQTRKCQSLHCYGLGLACVCVYSDSCCAVELLWGGWSSRSDHPPSRPSVCSHELTAYTHTHTALIRPPYCAPQIENSHTEGGRDKASGGEPKSSVVSCLTFPAGEHARWRIGVCSFPSSSQTSTQPRAENREALDVERGTFFQFKTCLWIVLV